MHNNEDLPEAPAKNAWYHQPWMWFIVGLPLFWVMLSLFGVYLSVKYKDDLVRDDWYKAGRAVNQDIKADVRARELGLSASLSFDPGAMRVTVVIQGPAGDAPLQLDLVHSTLASEDMTAVLSRGADGNWSGTLPRIPMGKRSLMLAPAGVASDDPSRWRLRASEIIFQGEPIPLTPGG